MLYTTYIIISGHKFIPKLFQDFSLAYFILILNRSITGIFFLGFYVFLFLIKYLRKLKILIISLSIILSVILLLIIDWAGLFTLTIFELKSLGFFISIIENFDFASALNHIWYWIGFRFSSVLSAYLNPTLFGFGMGNWFEGSSQAYEMYPFLKTTEWFILWCQGVECGHRPTALLAGMVMEIGLIPIAFLLVFILRSMKKNYDTRIFNLPTHLDLSYIWIFFFSLIFLGSIGDPITPTCLGIIINLYYKNLYRKNLSDY